MPIKSVTKTEVGGGKKEKKKLSKRIYRISQNIRIINVFLASLLSESSPSLGVTVHLTSLGCPPTLCWHYKWLFPSLLCDKVETGKGIRFLGLSCEARINAEKRVGATVLEGGSTMKLWLSLSWRCFFCAAMTEGSLGNRRFVFH